LVALAGALGAGLVGGALAAAVQDTPTTTTTSCPASNPPNELTLAGGTPQTAELDSPFGSPFQVALAASNGCPITTALAGTAVTFSAPASSASGRFATSGTSSVTVGTDPTGSASAPMFTANDIAGSYTVTASSSYGSVSFSLSNSAAGIAAALLRQTPVSQAASVNAEYGAPLRVLVRDADGNPVEGVTVTFTLGSSGSGAGADSSSAAGADNSSAAGATFITGQAQATETSNASGIATSRRFSANATAGSFDATAATAGVGEPATFSLDNLAGKPPVIRPLGTDRAVASIGTRYRRALAVEVVNAHGRPVEGATVTFTLGAATVGAGGSGSTGSSAGGSFVGGANTATATTNAAGRAVSPAFAANTVAGTFTATASIAATPTIASFALRNLAGKPATVTAGVAASEQTTLGSRFPLRLAVTVEDNDDNAVAGATVTFTAPVSGASGRFASPHHGRARTVRVKTGRTGVAVAPAFSANRTAGGYIVTATVKGAPTAAFALVNQPPGQ
jgi:hypothetical protein